MEALEAEDVGVGGDTEGVGCPGDRGGRDSFCVEGRDEVCPGGFEGVGS